MGTQPLDTGTAIGRLMLAVIGAVREKLIAAGSSANDLVMTYD